MVYLVRTHFPFLLILSLFIGGVLAQYAVLPIMEGGDEYLNYNYVQYLLRENQLPDRVTYLTNTMQQQSGQPPLVYWTATLLMRLVGLAPDDDSALWSRFETHKNPWYASPDQWNWVDNRNLFFHTGSEAFETSQIEKIDRVIRFSGLIFGVVAVIGAYGTARELFSRQVWALTATAIFAFTPQMVHLSSFINTDSGMIAFTTLAIWATLRLLRVGGSRFGCLVVGACLALACLSKVNALLIAPGIGVAILLDAYRHRLSWVQVIINGAMVSLSVIILFGPWVVYGLLTYNDPLGTKTHLRPGYFYEQPLNLVDLLPLLPEVYLGYWGKLGSTIYLHPITYTVLGVLPVASLGGYGIWLIARRRELAFRTLQIQQMLVLGTILLFSLVGLVHWLQTIHFITGRLMYQAHIVIAAIITSGLYTLARFIPRLKCPIMLYTLSMIILAGVILAPLSIYVAYSPPVRLNRMMLPVLEGNPIDFDQTIRFIGYHQTSSILSADLHRLTLCWEVLKPTQRPAAFSVKFVRDGNIIADRTSIHGMGRYPSSLWKTGDVWCDEVAVPVTGQVETGQAYDILLVMLDAQTGAVDWQATTLDGTFVQYPFIGQVNVPILMH